MCASFHSNAPVISTLHFDFQSLHAFAPTIQLSRFKTKCLHIIFSFSKSPGPFPSGNL